MKGNKCSTFTNIIINDVCGKFKQKYMFWSQYVEVWKPPLLCPFNGNYTVMNCDVDTTVPLALIAGSYRWLVYFKFFDMKTRNMISCFSVQTVILDRKELIRKFNLTQIDT